MWLVTNWLAGLSRSKRYKKVLKDYGCVRYCPKCNEILNDTSDWVEFGDELGHGVYRCHLCGESSIWNSPIDNSKDRPIM